MSRRSYVPIPLSVPGYRVRPGGGLRVVTPRPMENFSRGDGFVFVQPHVLGKCDYVPATGQIPEIAGVTVLPRSLRPQARQNGHARGIARGCHAERVREQYSAVGEGVDVRCFRLVLHDADPVVHVVDDNHQDVVSLGRGLAAMGRKQRKEYDQAGEILSYTVAASPPHNQAP